MPLHLCRVMAAWLSASSLLKRLRRDNEGTTSTEYALIAVLLTIVLIVAVTGLADSLVNLPLADLVTAINQQLSG